jgi:RNA polymerase sigma-70 factor (ECF subfamily)
MAPDPDAALLLAFQGGDHAAFRVLFEKYGRAMVAFCHRFVRDSARAEELAQDVFLKLHASAGAYRPTARFKTYLYRIATNHCLNELRRGEYAAARGRERDPEGDDLERLPGDGATPEQHAAAAALGRAVERLLASLPDKQRAAFVLCRFEGLSYEEVAEALGTSVSAVKSLVHRATVAAAEALAPFAPGGTGKEVAP